MDQHGEVPAQARGLIDKLVSECQKVVVGKVDAIESLLAALFSEGHILLEGVPGVAKTTLGKTFASALGLEFRRIQCTPDIMPADILGTHIFDQSKGRFRLEKGPIFSNMLLIDEINRNTPKTNSAVLEAMQERQVTIEGETQALPNPFMIIATQSPIDFHGVFPLPEVLIDRFLLSLKVDYPSIEEEVEITTRMSTGEPRRIAPVITSEQISYLVELSKKVYLAPHVQTYLVSLIRKTRGQETISLGASPRASIALAKTARARALMKGRLYVLPDDVKYFAPSILRHRLVVSPDQETAKDGIIEEILNEVPVPHKPYDGD
jgi:MoxR-like ATPase